MRRFFKPVLAQIARKLTEIAQGNGMEGRSPEQRWGHTGKTVKCWLVVVCFKTVDGLILAGATRAQQQGCHHSNYLLRNKCKEKTKTKNKFIFLKLEFIFSTVFGKGVLGRPYCLLSFFLLHISFSLQATPAAMLHAFSLSLHPPSCFSHFYC